MVDESAKSINNDVNEHNLAEQKNGIPDEGIVLLPQLLLQNLLVLGANLIGAFLK